MIPTVHEFRLAWLFWALTGFFIEGLAIYSNVWPGTLSEIVWNITKEYPLLPLALGLLMGHFFWQSVNGR